MTKREIIARLADKFEEIWETYPLPTDHDKRHEAFVELKKEVATYGYKGKAYTQLYNEACKIHEQRMGVKGNDGKP